MGGCLWFMESSQAAICSKRTVQRGKLCKEQDSGCQHCQKLHTHTCLHSQRLKGSPNLSQWDLGNCMPLKATCWSLNSLGPCVIAGVEDGDVEETQLVKM